MNRTVLALQAMSLTIIAAALILIGLSIENLSQANLDHNETERNLIKTNDSLTETNKEMLKQIWMLHERVQKLEAK